MGEGGRGGKVKGSSGYRYQSAKKICTGWCYSRASAFRTKHFLFAHTRAAECRSLADGWS